MSRSTHIRQAQIIMQELLEWLKLCAFVCFFSGLWVWAPPFLMVATAAALYASLLVFAPLVALYSAWFLYSWSWPHRGCMPWESYRKNSILMRWASEYFSYKIVKTADLPTEKNMIVGSHPHGLFCLGMFMSFQSHVSGITKLFKGLKTWSVTLDGQFLWPLRREILMWGGSGATSKRNIQWILRRKDKGNAVSIAIGGWNEGMMAAPGKYYIKLADRKGFVKLALTEGADLVPVFHFGENETYEPVVGICPNRLRNMQAHIVKTFGVCPPLLIGKSLLGLPWGGLVPMQTRLETVIGEAISVEKTENPTQEQIDDLHTAYCDKLVDLFEAHKANYGIQAEQKIILY